MAAHLSLFALIPVQEVSHMKLSWIRPAEITLCVVFLNKSCKIFHESQDLFQLLQIV